MVLGGVSIAYFACGLCDFGSVGIKPEMIISVRFRLATEGGRSNGVSGETYACPLVVGGDAFDCRIAVPPGGMDLGRTYDLALQFLFPELALPRMQVGTPISLWEGRPIADGVIAEVI